MKIPDPAHAAAQPGIECVPFGRTPDGTAVDVYRLTNSHGLGATITTYGGIVRSLLVPDREGKLGDIVLGYHNLAGYLAKSPYFGCLVDATATGSPEASSSSTARPMRWRRTMARTTCMVAGRVSTRWSGLPNHCLGAWEPAGYAGGAPSREGVEPLRVPMWILWGARGHKR